VIAVEAADDDAQYVCHVENSDGEAAVQVEGGQVSGGAGEIVAVQQVSVRAKARDDFGRQIDVMTYGLVVCRETEKDVAPGRNIRSDRTTRSSAIRPSAGRCSVRAQVRADPVRMGDGFRHGDQSCGSSNRKPTLSPT